jgi:hypothetical protein
VSENGISIFPSFVGPGGPFMPIPQHEPCQFYESPLFQRLA